MGYYLVLSKVSPFQFFFFCSGAARGARQATGGRRTVDRLDDFVGFHLIGPPFSATPPPPPPGPLRTGGGVEVQDGTLSGHSH